MRITAKRLILDALAAADRPLAVHELAITAYSENCLATRLPELARDGMVIGTPRPGKNYKEWRLIAAPAILSSEDPT